MEAPESTISYFSSGLTVEVDAALHSMSGLKEKKLRSPGAFREFCCDDVSVHLGYFPEAVEFVPDFLIT